GGTKAFLNPRRRCHYHPPSLSLSLGPLLARRTEREEAPPISDDGGIGGPTTRSAGRRRNRRWRGDQATCKERYQSDKEAAVRRKDSAVRR
ncbi:hypothetical protein LINPERHAP1_LOCUS25169, partial [Linum perenne]